ncbi:MAG: SpoIIIAH-like family protein [Clostridiales bacterium]|nr:SpoIIIAH-like family protein [Clostridiales bacterium]
MKIKNMKQVKEHMKDMNMKRLFRRNQIIITTLAVMIAAAGYLNYAGKKDLANGNRVYEAGAMDISDEDILAENQAASLNGQAGLQEIQSLDQDPSDLDAVSDMDGAQAAADSGTDANQLAQAGDVEEATQAAADTGTDAGQLAQAEDGASQTGLENPGEAVLTSGMSVADYIANVQLSREQIRAKNKETLMNLINSTSIDEAAKQQAIQDMIKLTEVSEKENAAETLLMAKGFSDPVVSITQDKVDVVINAPSITDPQLAQIEDIVKRKAEVGADQIIITLLNMAE